MGVGVLSDQRRVDDGGSVPIDLPQNKFPISFHSPDPLPLFLLRRQARKLVEELILGQVQEGVACVVICC